MLKAKKFGYHKKYGIVYIKDIKTYKSKNQYLVFDNEGNSHSILETHIKEIPESFVDYVMTKNFENDINDMALKKGLQISDNGRIYVDFENSPTVIAATVERKTVFIFADEDSVDLRCSCSYSNDGMYACHHIAAVLYYFLFWFNDLVINNIEHITSDEDTESELDENSIQRLFAKYTYSIQSKQEMIYGINALQKYANNEKYEFDFAKMLDYYIHSYFSRDIHPKIIKAAELISDSEYFVSYFKDVAAYYYYGNCEIDIPAKIEIDSKKMRFFTPKYSVSQQKRKVIVYYWLDSPINKRVIGFVEDFSGKIDIVDVEVADKKIIDMVSYTYYYIQSEYGEIIKDKVEQLNLQIAEEIERERLEILNNDLDKLCENLNKKGTLLSANNKAELEFIFNFYENTSYSNCPCSVELKIGIDRKYVVKNILTFASYFKNGETHKYGKGFEFTHIIDNIDDFQQETLKLILMCVSGLSNYELYHGNKALPLTGTNLDSILESLKDKTVTVKDEKILITLNPVKFRVNMSKEYKLNIDVPSENYNIINSGNICYMLDFENKRLDIMTENSEEINFLDFIRRNSGTSMEPVAERFRDEIYSRFYEKMDISENIKNRIHLSQLQINGYFDYVNSKITVKSEFFKNDVKITQDEQLSSLDIRYRENYYNYLEALGFEDNVMSNDSDIINFFSMNMNRLKKYCDVYLSDSIQNKSVHSFKTQIVKIQMKNNIMEAFLEDSDYSDKELKMIISSIRHKKKYVLLSDDRIVNLDIPEADEFEKTVSDLGLMADKLNEPVQIPIVQALRAFAHEKGCKIDSYLYNMIDDIKRFKKSEIEIPEINASLRSYQEEGFRWMKILSNYNVGGILADDMGLGKTLEVITLLSSDENNSASLVVCPKGLVFNWKNEFNRFSPNMNVVEIYGLPNQRHELIESINKNERICLITSYDSLRNDLEYYNFELNYMILDEAQYIKNVNALKSKSVKSLKAQHKFALTGTPIENNVLDLWSIFDFIMPGYLEELSKFKKSYSNNDDSNEIIAKRIAPFILRRTKKEVLKDLPDKYERIVSAEMIPAQRKIYDAYKMEAREALETGKGAFDILPYLMRLRQICDDPGLFIENYDNGSGKMDILFQILDEYLEAGHRILIFSQFVKAIDRIVEILNEKKISFYKITGETPAKDRIELMNDFNAGKKADVFLISLKSGGTGLNLIGADTVIHFDPWWNAAAEDQASDRAHRIGQTKNVEIIKLICENSVEQKVIELQNMKKDLIDKLISDSDKSVTGISVDDIKFILKN